MTELLRLDKRVVALIGCSRGHAQNYIEGGWVLVDGVVIEQPQFMVGDQQVALHPEARPDDPELATILLHAVADFDPSSGPLAAAGWFSAANQFEDDDSGVRPLKRHAFHQVCPLPLEAGASGLLVFTQDGRIARRLREDGSKLEQEYVVEVSGTIAADGLARINRGLSMDGHPLARVKASWQNEVRLRIAALDVRPGQIRHLCTEVGLGIVSMRRIRIARVAMGKLLPWQWRYLPDYAKF
jgi:23S rRNA pseudouridine2604 synthase